VVPQGGYALLVQGCPVRPGTNRAARWPLLVQHAGQANGKAALALALKGMDTYATGASMLRWCQRKGYVAV
jgi:hypothetical protein